MSLGDSSVVPPGTFNLSSGTVSNTVKRYSDNGNGYNDTNNRAPDWVGGRPALEPDRWPVLQ